MESAHVIREQVVAGRVSAREIAEQHIRRIEEVNPSINAVVIERFEQALEEAAALDDARARGEPAGPLHGVPMTIKEQYAVKGTALTLGLPNQVGEPSAEDGPLVAKLRRAGAVVLGKTNVAQTLTFHESDNPVYGRTANPWDVGRTPGGSSGGEAAIIAAGGSPLGLGGDLGGSIRVPAHFCGIHGIKPTSGRLTNTDSPAHLFPIGEEALIAQPGPLARSVADLALALRVLAAGPDRSADLPVPAPLGDPDQVRVSDLRIGMYTDDGWFPAAPAVRRAVEETAELLRSVGATVGPFTPPNASDGIRLFLGILGADGGKWLRRMLDGDRPDPRVKGFLTASSIPVWLRPLIAALFERQGQHRLALPVRTMGPKTAHGFWQLVEQRSEYRTRYLETMDRGRYDAVICPPYATPAFPHGAGDQLTVYSAGSHSSVYNTLGFPAGVVSVTRVRAGEESDRPASRDKADTAAATAEKGSAGLPVGVQVVARHWREDTVLAVMQALEHGFRANADYPLAVAESGLPGLG